MFIKYYRAAPHGSTWCSVPKIIFIEAVDLITKSEGHISMPKHFDPDVIARFKKQAPAFEAIYRYIQLMFNVILCNNI